MEFILSGGVVVNKVLGEVLDSFLVLFQVFGEVQFQETGFVYGSHGFTFTLLKMCLKIFLGAYSVTKFND